MTRASAWYVALCALVTLLAGFLIVSKVKLSPDVAELLPDRGEAAALSRYARAFGGGDPGIALIEGKSPSEVEAAAHDAQLALSRSPSVEAAFDHTELPYEPTPSQWMLLADERALTQLEAVLTPEGMRARLHDSRALLLSPGGSALSETLARDPLRIGELVASSQALGTAPSFVSPRGNARIVIASPKGNALRSEDANTFVRDAEAALAPVREAHPEATIRLTGGHAMAAATESLLRHDLAISSALSVILVSLAFVLLFERARALLAILPPLAAGTIVTASVAALFPHGLSAIAVAFASVVVGVGTDTGVHVYAAVQSAIAAGSIDPAAEARRKTGRAVMGAAIVAGCAFACMALSRVEAMRQLGILSAVGEVATAIAILGVTPAAAVWLERKSKKEANPPRWASAIAGWPSRALGIASAVVAVGAVIAVGLGMGPITSGSLVLVRPRDLAPADVYADLHRDFETVDRIPTVILVSDVDATRARARADAIFDALSHDPAIATIDSLTTFAPSSVTIAKRRKARDHLELASRAAELTNALRDEGFAPARFSAATADFLTPKVDLPDLAATSPLARRYLARDDEALAVVYAVPAAGQDARLASLVHDIDPRADVTGYGRLEPALRSALSQDLPRVSVAALLLVLGALSLTLRKLRDVALALAVIAAEIALVLLAMRLLSVPLHAYDALVLPVLLGITLDEVLFVLFALREHGHEGARDAVAREAPVVATTALTTAAGFGALIVCRFDALRHLAIVGAVGSAIGVVLALIAIPSWLLPRVSSGPGKR